MVYLLLLMMVALASAEQPRLEEFPDYVPGMDKDEFYNDQMLLLLEFHEAMRLRPEVQAHTEGHDWFPNLFMYNFMGYTLTNCAIWGVFYSFFFNVQGWYWDCIDNVRANLKLV